MTRGRPCDTRYTNEIIGVLAPSAPPGVESGEVGE